MKPLTTHNIDGHLVTEWQDISSQPSWKLLEGDVLDALALVENDSIDCVVTSPPYFWLRDYRVKGQIGLEKSVDAYVVKITEVMRQIRQKLKKAGVLFLNLGDTYYSGKGQPKGPDSKNTKRRFGLRVVDQSGGLGIGLQRKSIIGIPWRVAIAMCLDGWVLRAPIIWYRPNAMPEPTAKDRPSRSYEYLFMFVKSRKYFFNKQDLPSDNWAEDVWNISTTPGCKLDTAPFPEELVKRCLTVACPPKGTVLDPFCGSGTTLKVSISNGNNALGIELNHDFCQYILSNLPKWKENE